VRDLEGLVAVARLADDFELGIGARLDGLGRVLKR
jgi:hypothetical protein